MICSDPPLFLGESCRSKGRFCIYKPITWYTKLSSRRYWADIYLLEESKWSKYFQSNTCILHSFTFWIFCWKDTPFRVMYTKFFDKTRFKWIFTDDIWSYYHQRKFSQRISWWSKNPTCYRFQREYSITRSSLLPYSLLIPSHLFDSWNNSYRSTYQLSFYIYSALRFKVIRDRRRCIPLYRSTAYLTVWLYI